MDLQKQQTALQETSGTERDVECLRSPTPEKKRKDYVRANNHIDIPNERGIKFSHQSFGYQRITRGVNDE